MSSMRQPESGVLGERRGVGQLAAMDHLSEEYANPSKRRHQNGNGGGRGSQENSFIAVNNANLIREIKALRSKEGHQPLSRVLRSKTQQCGVEECTSKPTSQSACTGVGVREAFQELTLDGGSKKQTQESRQRAGTSQTHFKPGFSHHPVLSQAPSHGEGETRKPPNKSARLSIIAEYGGDEHLSQSGEK